ncbi:phage recombination protein Bet [Nocardiopsis dassonvillei]|uniref:phage recombination protein Bet n=1 Tax=Nocardiopsis dassonvillei TaxID=2014 RepID=UPI0020A24661|nr:phage recombination protein Bet [Nocardiopsis dassonvillei]MCP3017262.1 phage recombination protein Bet [Nocardiopsis dassonvillei]
MTTTTEIAVSNVGALALSPDQTEWTGPQTAALAQLGIADAPAGDQLVFLHYAQRTGLDPFARQIYMIGRKEWNPRTREETYKYTIQAGIDGLRVIAERTGRYEGRTPISWCGEDGVWRDVWLDRNRPPVAARCGVYKQGFREPTMSVALFEEYAAKKKDGALIALWASKPAHMIGKVAEALALKAAFPQDLSGIYTPEEMDRDEPKGEPGVGEAGESIATADAAAQAAMYAPKSEPMITREQKTEIAGRIRDLKFDKDDGLALYAAATGREVPMTTLLTAAEAEKVIDALVEEKRLREEPEVTDAEIVSDPWGVEVPSDVTADEEAATYAEFAGGDR